MKSKPTVLISSNNDAVNQRIYNLINLTNAFEIVGICNNSKCTEDALFMHKPNIAIISSEYKSECGVTIARRLKQAGVQSKLAMLTMAEDVDEMRLALEFGVKAYFIFSNDMQVFECLKTLCFGEYYFETQLYQKHYFAMMG